MNQYWESYWELCYRQRHGCPSRGIWQDIRNQVAMIFEILHWATPETDFHGLDLIIRTLGLEIRFLIHGEAATTHTHPRQGEMQLQQLMNRIERLQNVAVEATMNLDGMVLQQLRQGYQQQIYNTNFGPAGGTIVDLATLTALVDRAVNLFTWSIQRSEPAATHKSAAVSRQGSSYVHSRAPMLYHQRIPHELFVNNLNPTRGSESLPPSYDESVHRIGIHNQKASESQLSESGETKPSPSQSSRITVRPRVEAPQYQVAISPGYQSQQPSCSLHAQRRARAPTNDSNDSYGIPYRPKRQRRDSNRQYLDESDLAEIRQISSLFVIDPRSEHTSHGAEQLGIQRHVSETITQSRPRRNTSALCQVSTREVNHLQVNNIPRRLSLNTFLDETSVGLDDISNVAQSSMDQDERSFASTTSYQSLVNDSVSSKFETNPESADSTEPLRYSSSSSEFESDPSIGHPFTHVSESPFRPSTAPQNSCPENRVPMFSAETHHDINWYCFDSAEHLAIAHDRKISELSQEPEYRLWVRKNEESLLARAINTWLPCDLHHRRPNRFELLSLHGDESVLDYCTQRSNSSKIESASDSGEALGTTQSSVRGQACGANETQKQIDECRSFFDEDGKLGRLIKLAHWLFINSRGNEYFCEIDEDYLTDRFNLTSLNTEVQYYQYALDLITDVLDIEVDDDTREAIEKSARHLYGLVHARYIVTTRGLAKMSEKYKNGDFGKCPRVACIGQPLLPAGQHDNANMSAVKLYCSRCEDLYNPKSSRHAAVDGAYFGSSFHNMFFQVYPNLLPPKSQRRYEPKVFGFRVHAPAALARWQVAHSEKLKDTLKREGIETGFEVEEEEEREGEMEESDLEEDVGKDGIDDMFEVSRVAF